MTKPSKRKSARVKKKQASTPKVETPKPLDDAKERRATRASKQEPEKRPKTESAREREGDRRIEPKRGETARPSRDRRSTDVLERRAESRLEKRAESRDEGRRSQSAERRRSREASVESEPSRRGDTNHSQAREGSAVRRPERVDEGHASERALDAPSRSERGESAIRARRTTEDSTSRPRERATRRRASVVLDEAAPKAGALRGPASASAERRTSREKAFQTRIVKHSLAQREALENERAEAERQELERREALARQLDEGEFEGFRRDETVQHPLVTAVLVISSALIFAVVLVLLMREDRPPPAPPPVPVSAAVSRTPKPGPSKPAPIEILPPVPIEGGPELVEAPKVELVDPGEASVVANEILTRSPQHKVVAQFLEEFEQIRNQRGEDGTPFSDYRERVRLENELLERMRTLGDEAVPAITEFIKTLGGHPFQLFLARVIAIMDGPEANRAVGTLLTDFKDYGVRMQLVKSLPVGNDATRLIGQSLTKIDDANLRVMLLRELAHRTRDDEDSGPEATELFRHLALKDSNPTVRAEAIAVIGRRRLPGEREVLEKIVKDDEHATVRQRAIVSLARTAGEDSLPTLREVLEGKNDENVRASAVLALTLIGAPALPLLEAVARNDESPEIRGRAQRAIQSIRFALQQPEPSAP